MENKREYFDMPYEDICKNLASIGAALETIPVTGKRNCSIISGAITILEDIVNSYRVDEIVPAKIVKEGD